MENWLGWWGTDLGVGQERNVRELRVSRRVTGQAVESRHGSSVMKDYREVSRPVIH